MRNLLLFGDPAVLCVYVFRMRCSPPDDSATASFGSILCLVMFKSTPQLVRG